MMYDIHAALDVGKRDIQEDAVAFGLHEDMNPGFVVVADGMGGHVECIDCDICSTQRTGLGHGHHSCRASS